ncbi:NAD dependent epimerase/reductase-related protein [gut metagenome]|uniref:NAD dependent epimerase/reductase-related protein n=1 Tax=gut metagenome TaxID=749906 RepID=J9G6X0_9ZZZZ
MGSVLVTGASGFIGSFIVEAAVEHGFQTWAGVRTSSSRTYLRDERIQFFELDFVHPDQLRTLLQTHKKRYGKFDIIIHCAGVTKCADKRDFDRVNYRQTRDFIDALRELEMVPEQFIFISTLSVFGPIHEGDYQSISEHDLPQPNTAYGLSKLKAEQYLQSLIDFPYIIFRPTGVYGPREKDYFLMAQSICRHVDVAAGFKRQDLTFVYVKDIVQAVFLAIERKVTQRTYFLTDGEVYQSRTFSDLIARELGNPFVIRLKFPLIVLKIVSLLAEWVARCRGTSSTLNSDKYRIMKQRNWRCDIHSTCEELGYHPVYDLEKGVHETIAWYKQEGWL